MPNLKDKAIKDNTDLKTLKDKNEQWQIVFLKTTKLTSALYLITNFLPDNEPLKKALRDKALNLLATVHEYDLANCLSHIGHMTALLDVALSGPSVSVMNFSVVKGEYSNLQQTVLAEQARETTTYFEPIKPREIASSSINHSAPATPIPDLSYPLEVDRRQVIIDFIKARGWSSIRDIVEIVPNFSNKTVQRELQTLVRDGVLKKSGDRRWSRYQLAKN